MTVNTRKLLQKQSLREGELGMLKNDQEAGMGQQG